MAAGAGAAAGETSSALDGVGGAWAGWECHFTYHFDNDNDEEEKPLPAVQRVPDAYLPPALVEWEVDVWGWEGACLDRSVVNDGWVGRDVSDCKD